MKKEAEMPERAAKKKRQPTSDLFQCVMKKLDRIDGRLRSMETLQTLTTQAYQRQGTLIEDINKRCMEKLGQKCPLIDNGDEESGGEAPEKQADVGEDDAPRR